MIAYSISGMFYEGITWEDFFTDNDGYPNFTIETHNKESLEDCIIFPSDHDCNGDCNCGWRDIFLPEGVPLTKQTATDAIAKYLNVHPIQIEIIEKKYCVAV